MEINRPGVVAPGKVLDLGGLGHMAEVPDDAAWPEPPKFPWFGVEVRVHPALSDAALIDLLEKAGEYDDKDPRAAVAVKEFVREVIHPDDFDDFWKLGKANRYGTAEFAETAGRIIEAVTGDPTQGSSASPAGRSTTGARSADASYKETIEELEAEGRADLAEFYLISQEHGVAR